MRLPAGTCARTPGTYTRRRVCWLSFWSLLLRPSRSSSCSSIQLTARAAYVPIDLVGSFLLPAETTDNNDGITRINHNATEQDAEASHNRLRPECADVRTYSGS